MKRRGSFLAGMLTMLMIISLVGTVTAVKATVSKELAYRDIKITLDGETITPKDVNGNVVEPFIIDGTTYLPVRAVGESLGLNVGWDDATSTVILTTPNTSAPTPTPAPETPDGAFFTYSGNGDDVVSGLNTTEYSLLKVTHMGKGHFAVRAYYDDTYDLLVNTTEPYNGGKTLLHPGKEYTIEVSAEGAWTIEAYALGSSATDSFSGSGDVVTPVFVSTSNVYNIVADGDGHFAVKGYSLDGKYKLLVNTVDPYSGVVMLNKKGDYCFFEVTGERDFTITPLG